MLVLKINTIHFYWWNFYIFSLANDFIYILSIYSNCYSLSEFFRSICFFQKGIICSYLKLYVFFIRVILKDIY